MYMFCRFFIIDFVDYRGRVWCFIDVVFLCYWIVGIGIVIIFVLSVEYKVYNFEFRRQKVFQKVSVFQLDEKSLFLYFYYMGVQKEVLEIDFLIVVCERL